MFTLKSALEEKLLTYFFFNTEEKQYIQELAKKLAVDPGNLDKKLKQLEQQGIFLSEFQGKQRYYFLNKRFPLFQEYQSIINKTYGIENILREAIKTIPGVENCYLFGSVAKGTHDQLSDIDLLIIGTHNGLTLSKALTKLEKELGREINTVEMTKKEFIEKQKSQDPFITHVLDNIHVKLL